MLPAALHSFSQPAATEATIDLFSAVAARPELHERPDAASQNANWMDGR